MDASSEWFHRRSTNLVAACEVDEEEDEDDRHLVEIVEAAVEEEEDSDLVVAEVEEDSVKTADGLHQETVVRCRLGVRLLVDRRIVIRGQRIAIRRLRVGLRIVGLNPRAAHRIAIRGLRIAIRLLREGLQTDGLNHHAAHRIAIRGQRIANRRHLEDPRRVRTGNLRIEGMKNEGHRRPGSLEVALHPRLRNLVDTNGRRALETFLAHLRSPFQRLHDEAVRCRRSSTLWTILHLTHRVAAQRCRLSQVSI